MKWFDRLKQRLRPSPLPQPDYMKDPLERLRLLEAIERLPGYKDSLGAQFLEPIANGFHDVVTAEEAAEQDRRWAEMQRQQAEANQSETTSSQRAS